MKVEEMPHPEYYREVVQNPLMACQNLSLLLTGYDVTMEKVSLDHTSHYAPGRYGDMPHRRGLVRKRASIRAYAIPHFIGHSYDFDRAYTPPRFETAQPLPRMKYDGQMVGRASIDARYFKQQHMERKLREEQSKSRIDNDGHQYGRNNGILYIVYYIVLHILQ